MKALTKQDLIRIIDHNFEDDDIIFEDNWKLKQMWEQFGDDYHIEYGMWLLTKKNEKLGGS